MDQKQYWDFVSNTKQFTTPFQEDVFSRFVGKDSIIVDVGCGYGRILKQLSDLGYEKLIGFDHSIGMVERGKREYPQLDLRLMEGEKIDLKEESADAVILFAVLTCIVSDEKQKKLIGEIERILRPGGIFYVNDFLLNEDERNRKRYEAYEDRFGVYGAFELSEGAQVRHHSKEHIDKLLSSFREEVFEPVTFTTMNGNRSNGFFYIGRKQG